MSEVSIIIPVYNAEKYLEKCLDSICLQTFCDFEIICVNDGSFDKSRDILENYAKNDNRIKIINQENKGLSAARNKGLFEASSPWVSFIDADDWVLSSLYQKFIDAKCENDFDIYMFNATSDGKGKAHRPLQFFDIKNWENYERKVPIFKFNEYKTPFCGNVAVWNKIYKRKFLIDNKIVFQENVFFEDQAFAFEACLMAENIFINNEALYYYRQDVEGQITSKYDEIAFDIFKVLDKIENILHKTSKYDEYKYAFLQHFYSQISFVFCKIKDENKRKVFYKKMQEKIKSINFKNFYYDVLKNLLYIHLVEDIVTLDDKAFYNKNKNCFL